MTQTIKNLLVLFFAQLAFSTGTVLLVTVGGVVGSLLASDKSIATLPMVFFVVGTAVTTIPAALSMQRIGRRYGFCGSALLGCLGAWLGAEAVQFGSFSLFCVAASFLGMTMAFAQQFRFAATESVSESGAAYAVAFVLLGSIGGAFLGPALAGLTSDASIAAGFKSAFQWAAGFYLVACAVLFFYHNALSEDAPIDSVPARPLLGIVRNPLFVIAVLGGVVGQGVMTYLMTATPLSMHVVDGHSMADTGAVIRAHVIAMYLPSLVTAPLIARFGAQRLMFAGVLAMLLTLVCGLSGQAVMHYWWALVLLGVGWNFLFIGGTTLLVQNYSASERFKAQAFNDFSVFGASALASLLAGTLMFQLGWQAVLYSALPFLLAMIGVLLWSFRISRR